MRKLLIALLVLACASSAGAQVVGQGAAGTTPWPVVQPTSPTTSGTLGALNATVTLALGNADIAGVTIQGVYSSWSGIASFEGSADGGTTYFLLSVTSIDGSGAGTNYSSILPSGRTFYAATGGLTHVRVRASSYTSGTPTFYLNGSKYPNVVGVIPALANYTPVSINDTFGLSLSQAGSNNDLKVALTDLVPLSGAQRISTNSGTVNAGTQRVVLPTDQPTLSVSLAANQSVNVAQVAGTATSVNSGVKDAGTTRVILATDQPQLTNKLLVTPDSVALPANQSVNESQINGVTPLMGNGVTGTGSPRVTIASDNTAFPVNATLSAETTKVIGTVNQGTSPWVVSGTVTTTPPSNASSNLAQVAGTATSVNSGVKDAGTIRVILATDQPALTNKLLVTPDSVALPANQSVNLNQAAGTALDVNSGVKSAGTIRVILATDQPQLTNKLLVTPDSVALPANQSVNVAQMGGVATSMNTGVRDTGTQRVTVATNDLVPVSLAAETTKVIGTVNVAAAQTIAVTNATPANLQVTDTPIALTKGTQGATGFTTQDLKDAGRTLVTLTADNVVPILTTDTIVTMAKLVGDTVTAGVTTYAVTAAKTLRIQNITITQVPSSTTVAQLRVRLRTLSSGACTAAAGVVAGVWSLSSPPGTLAASAGGVETVSIPFPDGIEFSGATRNICFTMNALGAAAQLVTITMVGYEY